MKYLILVVAILLSGCATNTGVIPIGQETYMLSREAATGFGSIPNLKVEAYKEAGAYCTANRKKLQLVRVEETRPPFILGNYPRVELNFQCLDEGAVSSGPVRLQRDPDTIIEYRK